MGIFHDNIEKNEKTSPFNSTPYSYKFDRFCGESHTFEVYIPENIFILESCVNTIKQLRNTIPTGILVSASSENHVYKGNFVCLKIVVKLEDKSLRITPIENVRLAISDSISTLIVDVQAKHGVIIEKIFINDYSSNLTSIERLS